MELIFKERDMSNLISVQEVAKRDDFLLLKTNIETAVNESKAVMIFEESDIDKAGHFIKNFKALDKRIEKVRKEIVSPINDEVKSINNLFKTLTTMFEPELNRLTNESNELLREIRRRQEEQKKQEQKELEDSILNEAEMFNDVSVIDTIPQIEFKTEKLKTDSLTTVRTKKWRVVDLDKIDRKYLILDEKLIDKIRKDYDFDDKSPIEGIEFFTDETVRVK